VTDAVRVFLLDDHEVVRRGLRDLLEAAGGIEVVGEAGTADEALRRIPPTAPDVAISRRSPTTRHCSRRSWPVRPATS
jgi:DNA-binding NarL/FixJ family response regulator